MAHPEQLWFFQNVKAFFPKFFDSRRVLEVGSLDVNGSIRPLFSSCDYLGIDIGAGPGVDLVQNGEDFCEKSGSFDVAISTEVFEHTQNWDLILLNMLRLVNRSGIIIFSCASTGRTQHGTTIFHPSAAPLVAHSEYYLNLTKSDFLAVLNFEYWFSSHLFVEDLDCLYFVGLGQNFHGGEATMEILKSKYAEYLHLKHAKGLPHEYILKNMLVR